jgi:hypothetical protein
VEFRIISSNSISISGSHKLLILKCQSEATWQTIYAREQTCSILDTALDRAANLLLRYQANRDPSRYSGQRATTQLLLLSGVTVASPAALDSLGNAISQTNPDSCLYKAATRNINHLVPRAETRQDIAVRLSRTG